MSELFTNIQFYSNIIVGGATLMTSLAVIIQTFTKYNPFNGFREWLNEPTKIEINEIRTELKEHKIQLDEIHIQNLKSAVTNSCLPLSERVKAGQKYVDELRLNGEVSAQYKVLKELYEQELKEEYIKGGKTK